MKSLSPISIKNRPTYYHKFGLFLTALCTLMLEFNLIRVLSVSLWYHFAFMIISIALLGFGISGVVLVLSDRLKKIEINAFLSFISVLFAISILVSFYIINLIPFDPFSLFQDKIQFLYLPIYYLTITLPFFLAGLIVGTIFTRFQTEIGKLYFFDLVGAGLSCFVFIIVIPWVGGAGGISVISIIACITTVIFSMEKSKFKVIGLSAAAFIILVNFNFLINPGEYLQISVTPNKMFGQYIKDNPDLLMMTKWNTFSRVDVMKDDEERVDNYPVHIAIIDAGNSTTYIPNVPKVSDSLPPPYDASNLAMTLKTDSANVFVIGSGGGGEILAALSHNANSVTAVEINGILNDLIKKDFAGSWTLGLAKNRRVNIITDDARSYLRGKRFLFDVIISAHTISASATASGAMSLVENYILTEEAIKDYLIHLKPNGVLYISRPESQLPRLIATIKKSNSELGGIDSKNSFFIFRRPPETQENDYSYLAGIVYKKDGLNELDQTLLKTEADYLKMETIYDPKSNEEGIYQDIIQSDNLRETLSKYTQILTPATDDNPYFEHMTRFSSINPGLIKESFSRTKENAQYAFVQKPVAESTLIVLLIQAAILSVLLILIPILLKFKKVANLAGIKKGKYLLYFSLLGLGYIMIEICLIQKFTLFLGQPVYTLLTVISTMLVFSGIGSLFSDKIIRKLKNNIIYIFIIISALVVVIGFINPLLFQLLDRADILYRILISIVVIAPLSFFMGIPFPFGIKQIPSIVNTKDIHGELDVNRYLTAYSWGVNGFFSVIGSILVVMLSMSWGFKVVFVIAGVLYLGAMLTGKKMIVK